MRICVVTHSRAYFLIRCDGVTMEYEMLYAVCQFKVSNAEIWSTPLYHELNLKDVNLKLIFYFNSTPNCQNVVLHAKTSLFIFHVLNCRSFGKCR